VGLIFRLRLAAAVVVVALVVRPMMVLLVAL
jgi:hypothetical protein